MRRKRKRISRDRRVSFNGCIPPSATVLLAGVQAVKPGTGAVHRRLNHYLFHRVCSGHGWVSHPGGERHCLGPGDWFCCFPDQRIRYRQDDEAPWTYRWLGFRGSGLDAVFADAGLTRQTLVIRGVADPDFEPAHETICEHLAAEDVRRRLRATSALQDLLLGLLDSLVAPSAASPVDDERDYIDLARQFMLQHFADGIGAADVARVMGFERSYFSTRFAHSTGTTLADYLAALRQTRAEELLLEDELTVGEIAQAVGFASTRAFTRFFSVRVGLSPGCWRRARAG